MIFLIEYDRKKGVIERIEKFDPTRRLEAQRKRLRIELDLLTKGAVKEVVLLDAADERALHRTHARYFKTSGEIAGSMFDPEPSRS